MLHLDPRGLLTLSTVCLAAVAEALQGGGISMQERALLNRLRDSLGIAAAEVETLERDLQSNGPGHAPLLAS
jgi:hypothetical protein